jgi:hypothetical protein
MKTMDYRLSGPVVVVCLSALACVARVPGETTGSASATAGDTGEPGTSTEDPASTETASSAGSSTDAPTTGAGSSTDAPTTGAGACALVVGPYDEPPEADPDGCFAITSEAECEAKGDACIEIFGEPAECLDSQWCVTEPGAARFLGCRPFAICKPNPRMVCTATDSGILAFRTIGCTPMGFGPCQTDAAEPGSEPPPC